mgnify:CR=1 FL=1
MVSDTLLTDSHCHLNFPEFDQDRALVVERARDAGIERMLIPGVNIETCREALVLADDYPEVYAAIGVHPNSAMSWEDETYCELEEMSKHPRVVAIGEIGLDYYRKGAPVELQKQVFRVQLELAGNLGLPVIIHNREASDEVQKILLAWINTFTLRKSGLVHRPGVLHSFSGGRELALRFIELGFLIACSGSVTRTTAKKYHTTAAGIPLDSLLVETDAPSIATQTTPASQVEPRHAAEVARAIAGLRGSTFEEIAQATTDNAGRLFGLQGII